MSKRIQQIDSYANKFKQKKQEQPKTKENFVNKGLNFEELKDWDQIEDFQENKFKIIKKEENFNFKTKIAEKNDYENFSVNTSNFTNNFEDNEKIELSQLQNFENENNSQIKKKIGFSSNDNLISLIKAKDNNNLKDFSKKIEIIEEKEEEENLRNFNSFANNNNNYNNLIKEEDLVNINDNNCIRNLNDSDNFDLKLENSLNVTNNQLQEMKKEIIYLDRQNKKEIKDKTSNINNVNNINNNINIKNKENNLAKKRRQSPYLRSKQTEVEKPISIQTYQHNTNIMNFQPNQYGLQLASNLQNNPISNLNPQFPFYTQDNFQNYNNNFNINNNIKALNNNNNYSNFNISNNLSQLQMMQQQQFYYENNFNNNNFNNINNNILPSSSLLPNFYHNQFLSGNNVVDFKEKNNKNNIEKLKFINSKENNIKKPVKIKVDDKKTTENSNLEKKANFKYKPHSLKDYKNKFETQKKESLGLGPNLNTKEWNLKEENKKRLIEYTQSINNLNKNLNKNLDNSKEEDLKTVKSNNLNDKSLNNQKSASFSKKENSSNLEENDSFAQYEEDFLKDLKNNNNNNSTNNKNLETNKKTKNTHFHTLKNLKKEATLTTDESNLEKENKNENNNKLNENNISSITSKSRPKSSNKKILKEENLKKPKNKIYTTLNINNNLKLKQKNFESNLNEEFKEEKKARALSSKIKKLNNESDFSKNLLKNVELDNLIQNHNFYKNKIESIRSFVNKI